MFLRNERRGCVGVTTHIRVEVNSFYERDNFGFVPDMEGVVEGQADILPEDELFLSDRVRVGVDVDNFSWMRRG